MELNDSDAIGSAAGAGQCDMVEFLLEKSTDVNEVCYIYKDVNMLCIVMRRRGVRSIGLYVTIGMMCCSHCWRGGRMWICKMREGERPCRWHEKEEITSWWRS